MLTDCLEHLSRQGATPMLVAPVALPHDPVVRASLSEIEIQPTLFNENTCTVHLSRTVNSLYTIVLRCAKETLPQALGDPGADFIGTCLALDAAALFFVRGP